MSRWESPTYNSSLVDLSLAVRRQTRVLFRQFMDSIEKYSSSHIYHSIQLQARPDGEFLVPAPMGGTRAFSHCLLASAGGEAPVRDRENAWRASFFTEHGGSTTAGKRLLSTLDELSSAERAQRAEAAERAFKSFVELKAPARLANMPPPANDPRLVKVVAPGQVLEDAKFKEWKEAKDAKVRAAKEASEGEMAEIRREVEAMMERRRQEKAGSSGASGGQQLQVVAASPGARKQKSAKQLAVEKQLLLLKKQKNPLGQPIRLKLPRVTGPGKGGGPVSGGQGKQATRRRDNEHLDTMRVSRISDSIASRSSSDYSYENDSGGFQAEGDADGAGAPPVRSYPSHLSGLNNKEAISKMASLALTTCDPAATPSVSAAKALVVEEHMGAFLATNSGSRGDAAMTAATPTDSFASPSGFVNAQPWDHRYNVPAKLHYVAPKPEAVASQAKREKRNEKRARELAASSSSSSSSPKAGSQTHAAGDAPKATPIELQVPTSGLRQGGELSGSSNPSSAVQADGDRQGDSTAPPPPPLSASSSALLGSSGPATRQGPPSWDGFSGLGGGGDGTGSGPSDEPWDYGEFFAQGAEPLGSS